MPFITKNGEQSIPTAWTVVTNADTPANVTQLLGRWWREDGGFLALEFHLVVTGTMGGATNVKVTLPTYHGQQLLIDTTRIASTDTGTNHGRTAMFGMMDWFEEAVGWKAIRAVYTTTSQISFIENTQYIMQSQMTFGTHGSALRANRLRIPIQGWS